MTKKQIIEVIKDLENYHEEQMKKGNHIHEECNAGIYYSIGWLIQAFNIKCDSNGKIIEK